MNTIAERIKFAMNVRSKKQAELVRETGISKGAFSSYLSGLYNPKMDKLELIANALDVNVNWLSGENVPMENGSDRENTPAEYVFYKESEYLINDEDNVYLGLMTQNSALIPRFYIYANVSTNEMHILPLFLREDSKRFYQCPPELLTLEGHEIFTRDFDTLGLTLASSQIYYYGIDTSTYETQISSLEYSLQKKCYKECEETPFPVEEFIREIKKEALYLKSKNQ